MKMTFSAEEAAPADLLAETEVLYREIAGELAAVMDRVRRGEIGEAKATRNKPCATFARRFRW
ncbi:MAG: hypothetical protein R3D53_11970 [Paracoccaceae bacterium]